MIDAVCPRLPLCPLRFFEQRRCQQQETQPLRCAEQDDGTPVPLLLPCVFSNRPFLFMFSLSTFIIPAIRVLCNILGSMWLHVVCCLLARVCPHLRGCSNEMFLYPAWYYATHWTGVSAGNKHPAFLSWRQDIIVGRRNEVAVCGSSLVLSLTVPFTV